MLSDLFSTDPDWTQTIIRLILGVVFFAHGAQNTSGLVRRTRSEFNGRYDAPASPPSGSAVGIAVIMFAAIFMVNGRNGLFLNWFGDRKGRGYEPSPSRPSLT
jgi:putative oxidoreductase